MMLHKGSSYEIKWKGSLTNSRFTIKLLKDDELYVNIANNLENTGNFTWKIPDDIETSYRYKLEVYSNQEAYNKTYTADFIIIEKPETSTFTDQAHFRTSSPADGEGRYWMRHLHVNRNFISRHKRDQHFGNSVRLIKNKK